MGSLLRDLVTFPCQDACGELTTPARVEGAPVYRCPGCDSEWILLSEPDFMASRYTPTVPGRRARISSAMKSLRVALLSTMARMSVCGTSR